MVFFGERVTKFLFIRAKVTNVNSMELFIKNILFLYIQEILIIAVQ